MTGSVLTPLAERDLFEIGRNITAGSVARAERVIVYRPDTLPVQIAGVLHGARDVADLLNEYS